MLPRRARVNLRTMAKKGCSAFPKTPASLEPHHQIVYCHIRTLIGGSYPSVEVQSVYSTAPADWANEVLDNHLCFNEMLDNYHYFNEVLGSFSSSQNLMINYN